MPHHARRPRQRAAQGDLVPQNERLVCGDAERQAGRTGQGGGGDEGGTRANTGGRPHLHPPTPGQAGCRPRHGGGRRGRGPEPRNGDGRPGGGLQHPAQAGDAADGAVGPGVRRGGGDGAPVRHCPRRPRHQPDRRDPPQCLPRARHRRRPQALRAATELHPRAPRRTVAPRQHQGVLHGDGNHLWQHRLRDVRTVGRCRHAQHCHPHRHPHRHHGLHHPRVLPRAPVPRHVGRVRVGEQGGRDHRYSRPVGIRAAHHQVHQHALPHPALGHER
mmetsp:Transcript_62776/g.148667  ORF Transcript_62776/g.148667 Transcript_62776/m.148667 type:complete len:274 (-) Transcript_62776:231-1052(-)